MEDRDTGSKGLKLVTEYIYQQFKNADLRNPQGTKDSSAEFLNL